MGLEEQEIKQQYADYDSDFDFLSRFALSPDIEEFKHLDKNLVITNLNGKLKEPEKLRIILNQLHILKKYMVFTTKTEFVKEEEQEFEDEEGNKVIKIVPIFKEVEVMTCRYPKAYHQFMQRYRTFVTTSAARGGYLLNALQTKKFKQEQSIEDRTKVNPHWSMFKNNKSKTSKTLEDY